MSYEFAITEISTPWAAQLVRTADLQRAAAVLYRVSPRWLLMDDVSAVVVPNNDARSKPVLSILKSNRPDKLNPMPASDTVDADPPLTSTIKFLILSKSFFNWVLSWVDCIWISASVWVNNVSISSDDRP